MIEDAEAIMVEVAVAAPKTSESAVDVLVESEVVVIAEVDEHELKVEEQGSSGSGSCRSLRSSDLDEAVEMCLETIERS